MTKLNNYIKKMRKCSHLLPPPGGEVVRATLDAMELCMEQREMASEWTDEHGAIHQSELRVEADAALLALLDREPGEAPRATNTGLTSESVKQAFKEYRNGQGDG